MEKFLFLFYIYLLFIYIFRLKVYSESKMPAFSFPLISANGANSDKLLDRVAVITPSPCFIDFLSIFLYIILIIIYHDMF